MRHFTKLHFERLQTKYGSFQENAKVHYLANQQIHTGMIQISATTPSTEPDYLDFELQNMTNYIDNR